MNHQIDSPDNEHVEYGRMELESPFECMDDNKLARRWAVRNAQNYYRLEYINMKNVLSSFSPCYLAYLGDGPASAMELMDMFSDRNCKNKLRMLETMDLIESYKIDRMKCYRLTEKGRIISNALEVINSEVKAMDTKWKKDEIKRMTRVNQKITQN